MKNTIARNEAIGILVNDMLGRLSLADRESHLLDWWSLDAEDSEYLEISQRLREMLATADGPADPSDPEYDQLIRIALRASFIGVLNGYLEGRLLKLGLALTVTGEVEALAACPCCGFRTLERRGEYDICGVCFWEDDGTSQGANLSSPNHMTLGEARLNFMRIGAVSMDCVGEVLPDGKERYAHEAPH